MLSLHNICSPIFAAGVMILGCRFLCKASMQVLIFFMIICIWRQECGSHRQKLMFFPWRICIFPYLCFKRYDVCLSTGDCIWMIIFILGSSDFIDKCMSIISNHEITVNSKGYSINLTPSQRNQTRFELMFWIEVQP